MLFHTTGVARNFDRAVERRECFLVLPQIQVGIAQAHLQSGIIRRERRRLLQFGRGFIVFVPLGIHRAQVAVRKLIERIDLQLLVKRGGSVVVFTLLPVSPPQVIERKLVVRIHVQGLLERRDRLIVLPHSQVGQSEIVPGVLVLGLDFDRLLQHLHSQRKVAILHRRSGALIQFVRLHTGRWCGGSRSRVFDREMLAKVREYRPAKREIVTRAGGGQLAPRISMVRSAVNNVPSSL